MNRYSILRWFWRMLRAIAAGIRSIFLRIKYWFSAPPHQPGAATLQPGANESLDTDEPYHEYSQQIEGLDDITVKLGVHKRVSASHQYMYEMGRRDGALGVNLTNLVDIARAAALAMFRHINVILNGRMHALSTEVNAKKSIVENDEVIYRREQAYYDYVKYQYRFFPRNYSFLLFIIYLFFGLALIVTDMPLALKLIQTGFGLESGSGIASFPYLFQKGNFWNVIAANWETVVTAVGIALCTIYIKIYYDEFVGTPYANKLMTFKRFMEENGFDQQHDVAQHIKREHRIKNTIKTVLAIATILAILSMALFRLQTVKDNTSGLNYFKVNFTSGAAFVAITILFPVIGGISLSYALNNFQNRVRLIHAKNKYALCRRHLSEAVKAFTTVKKDHEDVLAAHVRLGDEDKVVNEYKDYLMAFYHRGYAIGAMQPEKYTKGEDFYSKILEWRNIAISRKINMSIGKMN